jgi:hypothetical protein
VTDERRLQATAAGASGLLGTLVGGLALTSTAI